MATYVRLYAFLGQIFDYGNTDIEKRFLFFKRLIPLLDFGRERDTVDLSKVMLTHHTLKSRGKLLENETLMQQATSNSKEQFANSPDLKDALMHAIMDALDAHTTMSTQALGSERVRDGLKDILLGPAQLYEALRARSGGAARL